MHIGKWLLKISNILYTFYNNVNFFFMILYFIKNLFTWSRYWFRTFEKTLLKTSKIVLMYSNSLARHFSSKFHAKCLLPRLDRLLPARSCLQNFNRCIFWKDYEKIYLVREIILWFLKKVAWGLVGRFWGVSFIFKINLTKLTSNFLRLSYLYRFCKAMYALWLASAM